MVTADSKTETFDDLATGQLNWANKVLQSINRRIDEEVMTGITQIKSVVGHVMDTQVSWEAAGKPPPSSRASNDFLIKKEGPVKGTRVEVINGGRVPHEPAQTMGL